ncbi:VOC family protein [Streptomyces sp. NPDC002896]|uniref:VOC family protein n=1 Tax=Streptomyces sp. NPDC002896 TaxID=3154438 RepID=UPI003322D6C8
MTHVERNPERITPRQFHEAAGGALLGYEERVGSEEDLIDPHGRGAPLYFQHMDMPRPQRNRVHVDVFVPHDQAEARIAAAVAVGGRLVTDEHAPSHWVLADAEGNEAGVGTCGWTGPEPVRQAIPAQQAALG